MKKYRIRKLCTHGVLRGFITTKIITTDCPPTVGSVIRENGFMISEYLVLSRQVMK